MKSLITIDVEGAIASDRRPSDAYESIDVLDAFLADIDQPVTLFVTPDVVEHRPSAVNGWLDVATVGLHVHPTRLAGGDSDRLNEYGREKIKGFLADGCGTFEDRLDVTPTCFRAGRWEYSEALLDALAYQGFDRDASLKPSIPTEPYTRKGVREYPLTVYANRAFQVLTAPWDFEGIPMTVDAFISNRIILAGFRAVSRRLIGSELPYFMISYHDYDILDNERRRRLRRYHTFLAERTTCVSLDAV